MRYVVLLDEKGFFTYRREVLHRFDEVEWSFISKSKDALPAMWMPLDGDRKSLFEKKEELWNKLRKEAEYKQYFAG